MHFALFDPFKTSLNRSYFISRLFFGVTLLNLACVQHDFAVLLQYKITFIPLVYFSLVSAAISWPQLNNIAHVDLHSAGTQDQRTEPLVLGIDSRNIPIYVVRGCAICRTCGRTCAFRQREVKLLNAGVGLDIYTREHQHQSPH